jgi:DNA-binding NarL/FixJ family response regulator
MMPTMNLTERTVALVEDDAILRETLREILESSPIWKVTGCHATGEDALDALLEDPPEVVLMDIQLPGISGIDCVARLKAAHPQVLVLMVTVYDNNDRVFKALAAGASGYLLKRDAPDHLLDSLEDLLAGGSPMSGAIARKMISFFQTPGPSPGAEQNLSPRERQILDLLVQGLIDKEIASNLDISRETVRTHLGKIYHKLQVRTRTEAVVKYLGH